MIVTSLVSKSSIFSGQTYGVNRITDSGEVEVRDGNGDLVRLDVDDVEWPDEAKDAAESLGRALLNQEDSVTALEIAQNEDVDPDSYVDEDYIKELTMDLDEQKKRVEYALIALRALGER